VTSNEFPHKLEQRRRELGMSKRALAVRARVSLPTVNRILSGKEKRLTIANVEAIAKALGVVIQLGAVTAVDEIENAFELREKQATKKATRLVRMVQGTMGLEAQAVNQTVLDQMVRQTVCELLAGSPRRLWND
jgi:transcriptional regulator with XRE-family HTH domain